MLLELVPNSVSCGVQLGWRIGHAFPDRVPLLQLSVRRVEEEVRFPSCLLVVGESGQAGQADPDAYCPRCILAQPRNRATTRLGSLDKQNLTVLAEAVG